MSGSDSDSSVELQKVSSRKGFKFAPEEVTLRIKIKPCKSSKKKKFGFCYDLQKGQSLPYSPPLES